MSVISYQAKELKSIPDCDVGDVVEVFQDYQTSKVARQVAMVVVAPRGRAVIFEPSSQCGYYDSYTPQSEAVRAFMEQHRDD